MITYYILSQFIHIKNCFNFEIIQDVGNNGDHFLIMRIQYNICKSPKFEPKVKRYSYAKYIWPKEAIDNYNMQTDLILQDITCSWPDIETVGVKMYVT